MIKSLRTVKVLDSKLVYKETCTSFVQKKIIIIFLSENGCFGKLCRAVLWWRNISSQLLAPLICFTRCLQQLANSNHLMPNPYFGQSRLKLFLSRLFRLHVFELSITFTG
ncbi:hypothetical protein Ancab_024440 [Ancistrocladus abbreviatus]